MDNFEKERNSFLKTAFILFGGALFCEFGRFLCLDIGNLGIIALIDRIMAILGFSGMFACLGKAAQAHLNHVALLKSGKGT